MMMNQYIQEPYPRRESYAPKKTFIYIGLGIFIILVIVSFFFLRKPHAPLKEPICGNGVCETSENCVDCPRDCKCESDEYCSRKRKVCVKIECGNEICDPGESSENCCDDCGCTSDIEICNRETHECYIEEAPISDDEVLRTVRNYFESKGKEIDHIEILGSTQIQNKKAKSVAVYIKDQEWRYMVAVTVDGEVIEIPIL